MSRLAGSVTYPGASDAQETQDTATSSHSRVDTRRREAQNTRDERPKPRGRGHNYNREKPTQQVYQPPRRNERHERTEEPVESSRKHTVKVEDVVPGEELLDCEDIIAQISDLTVRSDRSALQIKRNILGSKDLLDTMDEDEWQKVCESMTTTAMEHREPEFIADIIVALFQNEMFCSSMNYELMNASSNYIIESSDLPLPAFFSAILCAHWPRQFAKPFDNVNGILFTVVSLVKGWIELVNEDNERYYTAEKKPTYQTREDREEASVVTPEDTEDEEKVVEDPEVVNRCALALAELCDTAQKQLWNNWMSLTDEIYQCMKPAITHNVNISGVVKSRLLDTLMQMNQWTKTRKPAMKTGGTQTTSS